MDKSQVLAALADLKQDIAGKVPRNLLESWHQTDKTADDHSRMLEPYLKEGICVSSDAAGLSKIAGTKSLTEMMRIVSEPKDIIHARGKAIGGEGIGVWAADNTQMFYDKSIDPHAVLDQMVLAQRDIAGKEIKVGIGMHQGKFWHIGEGFFSEDADLVEHVAEELTEGGEILMTHNLRLQLDARYHDSIEEALKHNSHQIYRFKYDNFAAEDRGAHSDLIYPIPFSEDYYQALQAGDLHEDHPVSQKYTSRKVVILLKIYHKRHEHLLEELTHWTLSEDLVQRVASEYGVEVVKTNGDLSIMVCDEEFRAVQFAEELYQVVKQAGYEFSIGLAHDELLVFPLNKGGKDLAGNPVNIASKISEDIPEKNSLFIHESVNVKGKRQGYEAFKLNKSGIELRGVKRLN